MAHPTNVSDKYIHQDMNGNIEIMLTWDIPANFIIKLQNNEMFTIHDFPGFQISDSMSSIATFTIHKITSHHYLSDAPLLIHALMTNTYVKEIDFRFNPDTHLQQLLVENNTLTHISCVMNSHVLTALLIVEKLKQNTTVECLKMDIELSEFNERDYNLPCHMRTPERDEMEVEFTNMMYCEYGIDECLKRNILKKKMESLILSLNRIQIFVPEDILTLVHQKCIEKYRRIRLYP
jgi:hypothetical protein